MTIAIILLAAGQGTRMNSTKQKILHEVGGKPMVQHAFAAATAVATRPPVLVIGPGGDAVKALLGNDAAYIVQDEQLGTGHATQIVQPLLRGKAGQVIVTYGDMPLLRPQTLQQLARRQAETKAAVVLLSVLGDANSSFGRIVRAQAGHVVEIVEVAAARQRPDAAELLAIRELNVGLYCFDGNWLWQHIDQLPPRQARSGTEYYLTDMVGIAVQQQQRVEAVMLADAEEALGAGTRTELTLVEKAFRRRAVRYWLDHGVTIIDPESTYIDQDVIIGQDSVIWPNSYLQGQTSVGANCVIGPNSILRNAQLGDGCCVEAAVVENRSVAAGTKIRPFSHLC